MLASGEYFLKEDERKYKKASEKKEKEIEADKRRQAKRNQAFVPPEEAPAQKRKKESSDVDLDALKAKVNKAQKKKKFKAAWRNFA